MLKNTFKHYGIGGKLMLLLLLVLFFLLLGLALISFLFEQVSDIRVLKIQQLILSIFMLIIPAIVVGYLWYDKPWQAYSLHRLPSVKQVVLSVILILSVSPFINLLAFVNEQILVFPEFLSGLEQLLRSMEERANTLTKQMLAVDTVSGLSLNLLVMAVLPAVSEELLCRGALQNTFAERWSKNASVWITAVIFSLIHFQMYGFLPRMVLGALLGYLLIWSRSIWLPMLIHFVNNAFIVVTFYFFSESAVFETLQDLGKAATWCYGVISAIVSALIIREIATTRKE